MHLPSSTPPPSSLPLELLLPLPLLGLLIALYALLAPRIPTEKQRAYLLSAVSSASMTLLSLPHVYCYLRYGLEEAFERAQHGWMGLGARVGVVGFGVYLFADVSGGSCQDGAERGGWISTDAQLAVGYIMYPQQIGLLTGWIHHTVYIGIMIYLAQTRLGPMFLIAAIMELPTFDLAISTLFPALRSDERFLSLFLALRIIFHAYLLVDTARPRARAAMDGSAVPAAILALALVLHVSWFQAGVTGYLRRRRAGTRGSTMTKIKTKGEDGLSVSVSEREAGSHVESGLHATSSSLNTVNENSNSAGIDSDSTPSPADSPLVTPLTPRALTPSALAYIPSALNLPALPALPALSLPPSLSLSRLGDVSGFKDAVRARWEGHVHTQDRDQGQEEKGSKGRAKAFGLTWGAGAAGVRRRKGMGKGRGGASGAEMGEAPARSGVEGEGEGEGEGDGVVRVVEGERRPVFVHVHDGQE